ncbi:MAG: glutamine amidotransferase-related protein [Allosphingosinicella sp.]
MDVAILVAGEPPAGLAERFGRYDAMFERLLGPGFRAASYDVRAGELPARPDAHAACLITGSPAGVYDPLPWIAPLEAFLREAKGRTRLVGICFGHQVMAEAFGGHVEKSARGWGVGLQHYEVEARPDWMADAPERIAVPVSHQDQIVRQPPATRVLAGSAFSPFGMLAWDDQPAMSMQFHPEFEPAFSRALIEARRELLPDPDAAIASLDAPDDRALVAQWIRRFLRT